MAITDVQLFGSMQLLDVEVEQVEKSFEEIEHQLALPHSSQDYYQLFVDLDKALKPIKELKKGAATLENYGRKFLERLSLIEQKAPTIFGELISLAVDREVVEIKSEAENLQNSLLSGNLLNVAKKVDSLKQHISNLLHDNALSRKNLTIIGSVERFVSMVEKFIEMAQEAHENLQLSDMQRANLSQNLSVFERDPVSAELLMEIFEVAELFESGSCNAVRRKQQLHPALQRRLEVLKGELEERFGHSSDQLYAPALLALALELSRGSPV
ncbi:MAG: hypothetical protein HYX48_05905 [Chlamydiales bacterium]|nr:hypothetical protein [Chlamydiales bacterium]